MKYHDNTVYGNQYGEDGYLTDNWDPDKKYPENEYINVYFRMRTKGFVGSVGHFESDEAKTSFTEEKLKVFQSIGWKNQNIDHNGICMTVVCGKQSLYLHPQVFSGNVLKNEVKRIAEALENNQTFKCEWVDLYKTVLDISDEEYNEYLETKREDTKKAVFKAAKTKRRNHFIPEESVIDSAARHIMLPRIGCGSTHIADDQTKMFVKLIIREMIEEGYIVGALLAGHTAFLIRSVNKTELKEKKLPIL